MPFDVTEIIRAAAGPLGAGLHALWSKEAQIARKIILFLAGSAISVIAHKEASQQIHIDGALLSFMLGFGAIAFLSKLLEAWQGLNVGRIMSGLANKYLGLKLESAPAPLNSASKPAPLKD